MKLDAALDWYRTLTPESIAAVGEIYHEAARFRDPFNDVRGHEAIAGIFRHMFETTENPAFRIWAAHQDGTTAWVSWTFDFGLRGKAVSIDGATRLDFAADGRVLEHRDYWDAVDLLVQLPLLGGMLRLVRKKLAATPGTKGKDKSNNE